MKKIFIILIISLFVGGCSKQIMTPETYAPSFVASPTIQPVIMVTHTPPTPTPQSEFFFSWASNVSDNYIEFSESHIGKYVIRRWVTDNNFVKYAISSDDQEEVSLPIFPEDSGWGRLDGLTGQDITGEGDPDVIIHISSGGNGCCRLVQVYNLGETIEKVFEFYNARAGDFEDLNGDGIYEYVTLDSTFEFEDFTGTASCGHAVAPFPKVIFRYSPQQGYSLANLQFPEYYKPSIILHTKELEEYATTSNPDICAVAPLVLDYLYSGQTEKAWEILYQIYPNEVAGRYKAFIENKLKDDIFFDKP